MINLPDYPGPSAAEAVLIDFGGFLQPGLGGRVQRIDRPGNRFKLVVTMPPLRSAEDGRIWVSRLIRGKSEGVRIDYPLLDFNPGTPGAVVIDGAGQAGRTLLVRGATPNYAFREGQPFSIEQDDQHYLYFVDGPALADASGDASLSISPMLRAETIDGAVCHFGKPMIEGYIMGDEWRWQMSLEHHIGIQFEIAERA